MDLEAIIRLQNFVYAVIYKRVPHDDILPECKKSGRSVAPDLCILQKFSHIVHALIYDLIVLYFVKQRPITYIEQFCSFPPVPVGFM